MKIYVVARGYSSDLSGCMFFQDLEEAISQLNRTNNKFSSSVKLIEVDIGKISYNNVDKTKGFNGYRMFNQNKLEFE